MKKVVSKMGKVLFFGLVLAIIAISIGCSNEGQPSDGGPIGGTVVTFPDSNLEIAVREAIGKPEGPIHTSELEGLSSLSAPRREITDLTGLEYTNLTHLSLAYNAISDLSPLASLTNLTWLDLAFNQVNDLSPLASLTDLTMLHLSYNAISDVSPLASLTNLTWLHLGQNQVSDISQLASLTNLTWLSLGENQVDDISPLASLINLIHLGLDVNQTGDIASLASLTDLTWLHLGQNQVSDLSPLASLTKLNWLNLAYNQVSDLSPLASLINLIHLDLDVNQTSDISPLASLADLTWLSLGENQVSDISPLASLTNLTWLSLAYNQVSDISPLAENSGLSQGDTVNLLSNPLDTRSVNVYIPQLEGRRVDVEYFKLHRVVSYATFMVFQHINREVELAAKEVKLMPDDLFTVTLASNLTTGFQWSESAQIDDQSVLEQQAHRFVPPEEDTPGAAGNEVWTFKALKEGSTEVYMEYGQPWEDGKKAEWTFRLIVVVK